MMEPVWVERDQIVAINEFVVLERGEPFLVRDETLLGGALARPYSHWSYARETDLFTLA